MRKIMLIAALIGFGGLAYADAPKPLFAVPDGKQIGDVVDPGIIKISRIGLTAEGPFCVLEVNILLADGRLLQLRGDTREGNGRGRLIPVNAGFYNYPTQVEAGRFAMVGTRNVLLEINGLNGVSIFGLFKQVTVGPRLAQSMGTGWKLTDGEALYNFSRDISTVGLNDADLASGFNRAPNADMFLADLMNNGLVPDSIARPNCTNCNVVNVPVNAGGPVVTPFGGYGPGGLSPLADPSLIRR